MFPPTLRLAGFAALLSVTVQVFHARAVEPASSAFEAFGGKPGIAHIADLGIDKVLVDPRIKDRFTHANIPRLKPSLADQFCVLLDGPCEYKGPDMKSAHAGMGLKDADFNALAEDFQIAMTESNIPYFWQNKLVAKLAPMERDISAK